MWISDFAIRRPIITIVSMLVLVIFGLVSLFVLETDEFPEVNPPVVNLSIPYPGASPRVVEREVIEPVEDALASISGVDRITSSSLDGFGIVTVEFVFEKDLQQATQDIRDRLSEIRQDLPLEIEEPILTRFDPNDFPIVSLTVASSELTPGELTRLVDPDITGEMQSLSGVAQVNVIGGVDPQLTVELRPEALRAAGISVAQVAQALREANLAAPVGRVTAEREERTIRLEGRLQEPADFADIVVSRSGGQLVRLGEVADVYAGTEEPRTLALFNGREAVGIDIVKTTGASTTSVSESIMGRVEEIRQRLPAGVELAVVRNAGERVEESVSEVQRTLIEGALLTILVVFIFLNSWRSTVITGLALPVSVLASFIAVLAFGFTLNTMSLLGLSLAIGLLIDDAIVVRENIVRHMEMGKDEYTAAREGTAEIGPAVAAITLSIMVVFVPIGFMGGLGEQFMAPMALTIASSVLVSLFVSFSLDPMLSAYWPDPEVMGEHRSWLGNRLERFNDWFDRRTITYKRLIRWALEHRLAMAAIAIGSFVVALAMPAAGLIGVAFFPIQDISEFTVNLDMPAGSSLEYSRQKAIAASQIARRAEGVEYTYTTIGGQGGTVDQASIYVHLIPKSERDFHQDEVANEIRVELNRLSGVTASVAAGGFGPQKMIQLQLQGPDIDVLTSLAEEVRAIVAEVPGAVDVGLSTRGERPEYTVELDRDLAASLGLSVGQVAQALRPAFAGIDVGDWVDPAGETREVFIRFAPEARAGSQDLETLPLLVPGPQGVPIAVPLGQVAAVTRGMGPTQIQRLERRRSVNVEANARDRPLSDVISGIQERIDEVELPPGYSISQGGDVEIQQDVFGRIIAALFVAVLLMYLVLTVQFGSFIDPIPIMVSLPLSLIGVMLALLITGTTLNLMSMIGIILLMGVVAKNAILLIDFAKWAQEDGLDRKTAIIEAGGVRLRPILMTSVAIVAGMFPVALGLGEGADFRAPLGRAVIGGVITSTLLTLLVIPTFYDIFAEWRDRFVARFFGRRDAAGPEDSRRSLQPHREPVSAPGD